MARIEMEFNNIETSIEFDNAYGSHLFIEKLELALQIVGVDPKAVAKELLKDE